MDCDGDGRIAADFDQVGPISENRVEIADEGFGAVRWDVAAALVSIPGRFIQIGDELDRP